jgi:hypothetical protein
MYVALIHCTLDDHVYIYMSYGDEENKPECQLPATSQASENKAAQD